MSLVACPLCKQPRPPAAIYSLNHNQRGLVCNGCADCLLGELDELAKVRGTDCHVCGATKEATRFAGVGTKLECPVHVYARPLLGRALQALRKLATPEATELNVLCMDLVQALGVKEKT